MKKLIALIIIFIAVAAAVSVVYWRRASAYRQSPIITITEEEAAALDPNNFEIYVPFTPAQMKSIRKRVLYNLGRTHNGGKPLTEEEMREAVNYLAALATGRFNIRVDSLTISNQVLSAIGAQAVCYPMYDAENKIANQPILIDKSAYENAKATPQGMVRMFYLVVHEVGHGVEKDATHNPLSLTGLVLNLWYDAKGVIPEYVNNEFRSQLHEMVADVFADEVILNELVPHIDMDDYDSGFGLNVEAAYASQLKDRSARLLMAVLPGAAEALNVMPYNDVTMVSGVTAAYANGQIKPNAAVAPLFTGDGHVPTFAEFIAYMDKTYGISQIKNGFADETINGYSVDSLKRFTLCAPFILGIQDVPYKTYNEYIAALAEQYTDIEILKDIERVWIPGWAAEVSNKAFAQMIITTP